MNPYLFTPIRLILIAMAGFCIAAYLAYYWLTQPILTAANITVYTGTVKNAQEFGGEYAHLEITLDDHPYSYRCFSDVYPQAFRFDLHGHLHVGTPVSLGVANSEVNNPRHDWSQNEKFYEIVTMTVDGSEALSVDAHNKSVENNRRNGPWFCLAMVLLSSWLAWLGFRHRNSSQSIIEILKAKKT
jgi:hypothetical protein